MQCPKCQHENPTEALFCMKCGTQLERKCPQCSAAYPEDVLFCMKCGGKLGEAISTTAETSVPKLEDLHAQLQTLIPDALAQKYLSAEGEIAGENRLITALFADISGSTELSTTRSTESMFQLIQNCFKALVDIVASYEGSISGFRGDGLLAMFGAPILHENDAERAILAAIDMRESMHTQGLDITVGINTALMTVGEIKTQLHAEYTAYGTEIVLAKRLQENAERGQILVSTSTHRQTRRAFDFRKIEDLSLKGIGEGMVAYEMQNVKVHPEKVRGIEELRAQMIGREREFSDLKDATDFWQSGQGQIVFIIGEAGIGKSRLVSELKTYLTSPPAGEGGGKGAGGLGSSPTLLEGRCISIGQPISYWPFLDILRTYFGLREDDTEAQIANKVTESVTSLFPQNAEEFLPFIGRLLSIRFGNELDKRLDFATPDQIKHQTMMRLKDFFEALAISTSSNMTHVGQAVPDRMGNRQAQPDCPTLNLTKEGFDAHPRRFALGGRPVA